MTSNLKKQLKFLKINLCLFGVERRAVAKEKLQKEKNNCNATARASRLLDLKENRKKCANTEKDTHDSQSNQKHFFLISQESPIIISISTGCIVHFSAPPRAVNMDLFGKAQLLSWLEIYSF